MEKRIFIAVLISIAFSVDLGGARSEALSRAGEEAAPPERRDCHDGDAGTTAPATPPTATRRPPPNAAAGHAAPRRSPARDARSRRHVRRHARLHRRLLQPRRASWSRSSSSTTRTKSEQPVELVKAREPNRTDFPFAIEATDAQLRPARSTARSTPSTEVTSEGRARRRVPLRRRRRHRVTKTFRFGRRVSVRLRGQRSRRRCRTASPIGPGIRTLGPDERDNQFIVTGNGVVQRDDSLKVISREKADRVNIYDAVAVRRHRGQLLPHRAAAGERRTARSCARSTFPPAEEEKRKRALRRPSTRRPTARSPAQAFFGPKETKILDRYGFESTLQFGMLRHHRALPARRRCIWLNKFTKNYGLAIIVLTIIIKIVLYPLQHKCDRLDEEDAEGAAEDGGDQGHATRRRRPIPSSGRR